jgi:general nucleoside transport system permease protein
VTAVLDAPPPRTPPTAAAPKARRLDPRRIGLAVAAPLVAAVFALLVSSIALVASGSAPLEVYRTMLSDGTELRSVIITINNAVPLYLAGVAVAIGFRMALFNIGVEGQYALAALLAASAGAAVDLPMVLQLPLILLVAVTVGAAWAGVAAVLKVTRGVSEVISTILLNVVAAGLVAYLLAEHLQERVEGSNNSQTPELPASARFPTLDPTLEALGITPPQGTRLGGFLLVAVVVGVLYWLLVSRSRFGFDLKAAGTNPFAARASGVDTRRTTVIALLLSGGVAGLVGMAQVLGTSFSYGLSFTAGLGFTGIGVALLGRNSPVGIAFAALLFAFLERSSSTLQFIDVPTEIYVIMQGSIVLSVVVAYEAVRRIAATQAERAVRRATS